MELLEGETLAERLEGRAAAGQVLRFGVEIAERSAPRTGRGSSTATSSPATSC